MFPPKIAWIPAPMLPTIERDLHTTNTWGTWVFTGFLLTSAIATPLLGKLGDMHGKKRLLLIAMGIFLVGTVAAAFDRWLQPDAGRHSRAI